MRAPEFINPGQKERVSSAQTYSALSQGVNRIASNYPQLSLSDFNVFCHQQLTHTPDQTGYFSIEELALLVNVDYKSVYEMVDFNARQARVKTTPGEPQQEIAAIPVTASEDQLKVGNWRIPAAAFAIHFDVAVWHTQEDDQPTRLTQRDQGLLGILNLDEHAPTPNTAQYWHRYVASVLNEVPPQCSWKSLVTASTPSESI